MATNWFLPFVVSVLIAGCQCQGDGVSEEVIQFTPEEQGMSHELRMKLAKTVETKLMEMLVAIAKTESRQSRQFDYDDDDDDAVTPDPTVIPQVAQILGAIFSGNINITSVADQTVGLVPSLIRAQLMGLTKILSGQARLPTFPPLFRTTPRPTTPKRVRRTRRPRTTPVPTTRVPEVKITEPSVVVTEAPVVVVTQPPPPPPPVTGYGEGTLAVKDSPMKIPSIFLIEDDELENDDFKLLQEIKKYRPYLSKMRESRFVEPFKSMFNLNGTNFNTTNIVNAVPSFVKSARQAMQILQTLGVLDEDLGFGDVINDLDLDLFDL